MVSAPEHAGCPVISHDWHKATDSTFSFNSDFASPRLAARLFLTLPCPFLPEAEDYLCRHTL